MKPIPDSVDGHGVSPARALCAAITVLLGVGVVGCSQADPLKATYEAGYTAAAALEEPPGRQESVV